MSAALEQRPARGIAIMVLGLTVFAVLNGVVKDQAARFPVTEIIFFRNLFGLIPLLIAVPFTDGWSSLRPLNLTGHVAQAVAMSVTLVCAYVAFGSIPLADATAILFLQPALTTILADLILRERAGRSAWIAVGLGFVGVLFIARPGGMSFGFGTLAAVAAALFASVALLQVRVLSARNRSLSITIWYMALSTVIFLPTLPFFWVTPSGGDLAGLVLMGLASGVGQFLIILPLRYAGLARLAPVQYFSILGGVAVGYLWFGEIHGWSTIVGSVVVIAAVALVMPRPRVRVPATAK